MRREKVTVTIRWRGCARPEAAGAKANLAPCRSLSIPRRLRPSLAPFDDGPDAHRSTQLPPRICPQRTAGIRSSRHEDLSKKLLPQPQQEKRCRQLCHRRWASFLGTIKHVFSSNWPANHAKEVESGPAVADGAALFGHGSEGFHGPRSTILFLFFVAPCFDRGGAPGPLLGMKSKFVVISVSIYFTA